MSGEWLLNSLSVTCHDCPWMAERRAQITSPTQPPESGGNNTIAAVSSLYQWGNLGEITSMFKVVFDTHPTSAAGENRLSQPFNNSKKKGYQGRS